MCNLLNFDVTIFSSPTCRKTKKRTKNKLHIYFVKQIGFNLISRLSTFWPYVKPATPIECGLSISIVHVYYLWQVISPQYAMIQQILLNYFLALMIDTNYSTFLTREVIFQCWETWYNSLKILPLKNSESDPKSL